MIFLWPVLTFEVVFLIIDIAMGMSLSTLTFIKNIFIPLSIESYTNVEVYILMHLVANKTLLWYHV